MSHTCQEATAKVSCSTSTRNKPQVLWRPPLLHSTTPAPDHRQTCNLTIPMPSWSSGRTLGYEMNALSKDICCRPTGILHLASPLHLVFLLRKDLQSLLFFVLCPRHIVFPSRRQLGAHHLSRLPVSVLPGPLEALKSLLFFKSVSAESTAKVALL